MSGRTGVTTLPSSTAAERRHAAPRRPTAQRRRVALIVVAELVLTASALLLLYLGWYLVVDDRIVAAEQTGAADAQVRAWDAAPIPAADAPVDPEPGDTFAVIRVPRFGADWRRPVVEGTSTSELDRGVGHYAGTALPGKVGNFSVAGHRLTHGSAFTRIAELEAGDVVGVRTATTWFVYRVTSSAIVAPEDVEVIAPVPGAPGVAPTEALLTLTSCHPLHGSSERYVVHGSLLTTAPAADGVPEALLEEVA